MRDFDTFKFSPLRAETEIEYTLPILHEKSDMNESRKSVSVSKQNAAQTTKGLRDVTITPMSLMQTITVSGVD